MYFYSDLIILSKQKFYSKFASSCALIYSIRFLDFTIIAWLLTNVSDNPSSIGALVFIKFIPMMFSGLITGWLVDKFSRLAIIKFVIISHSIYLISWASFMIFFSINIEIIFIMTFISGLSLIHI